MIHIVVEAETVTAKKNLATSAPLFAEQSLPPEMLRSLSSDILAQMLPEHQERQAIAGVA
jgi:hypothetical protein